MANVNITDMPDQLFEKIKSSAKANRRSVNSEIIAWLEKTGQDTLDAEELLVRIRSNRERLTGVFLTDESILKAIDEGRP